jgi:RND family efflux transporter MFP subunit
MKVVDMRVAVLALSCVGIIAVSGPSARGADSFTVEPIVILDEKAVFATVESARIVPARARIGGTVAELAVKDGDRVVSGQILATVGDEKLVLQLKSLDAQIAGLDAQVAQAQTDFTRIEGLVERGTLPRIRLDEVRTTLNVAQNAHRSRVAERSVVQQQLSEGQVLAPTDGRVLKVPVTVGTVLLPGEPVATIAEGNFVLRLRVPESHARLLKAGDPIRLDGKDIGQSGPRFGTIRLVYPQLEDGRVVADAAVEGLGDYFVGERIRVWISGGERSAFIVPTRFVVTRFGVDYVRIPKDERTVVDVPVQRGRDHPSPDMPDGLEILSGLTIGDRLEPL